MFGVLVQSLSNVTSVHGQVIGSKHMFCAWGRYFGTSVSTIDPGCETLEYPNWWQCDSLSLASLQVERKNEGFDYDSVLASASTPDCSILHLQ